MSDIDDLKAEIKLLNQVIENMSEKLKLTGEALEKAEKALEEERKDNGRLVKINEEILAAAYTDPLTGLHNRRKFNEFYSQEYKRAKRYNQPFSVIMMDIDDFKSINDTFGHNVGDLVIKFVAGVIRNKIRESDLAFRWGGEEFLMILPNTSVFQAAQFTERIRMEIEEHVFESFKVTISSGISYFSKSLEPEQIIKKADDALYESKRQGKNQTTIK